jgi:hypothetical protein
MERERGGDFRACRDIRSKKCRPDFQIRWLLVALRAHSRSRRAPPARVIGSFALPLGQASANMSLLGAIIMSVLPVTSALAPQQQQKLSCTMKPIRLRANNLAEPLGITMATPPRLSWALEATDSSARGLVQSAYRIRVCSSEPCHTAPDIWDR